MMGLSLKELLSILLRRSSRNGFKAGLQFVRSIGAKWWRRLDMASRMKYANLQLLMTKDETDVDYHVGMLFKKKKIDGKDKMVLVNKEDADEWQQRVIGLVDEYIELIEQLSTKKFVASERISFKQKLSEKIESTKSWFEFKLLIEALAGYQFDGENDHVIPYDHGPITMKIAMSWLDMFADAKKVFKELPPLIQHLLILQAYNTGKNGGYPNWSTQTYENIGESLDKICKKIGFKTKDFKYNGEGFDSIRNKDEDELKGDQLLLKRIQEEIGVEIQTDDLLLSLDLFDNLIAYCERVKYYAPSTLFKRTQIKKRTRTVFGDDELGKFMSAVFKALKKYAYTASIARKHFTYPSDYPEDEHVKQLPTYGGMPLMAQMDGDELFEMIVHRCPLVKDGEVQPMETDKLQSLFTRLPDWIIEKESWYIEIVGEDYAAFDNDVRRHQIDFLEKHRDFGKFATYLFNKIENNEVWIGDSRVVDGIFWKSGHGWTSDGGSFVHADRIEAWWIWFKEKYVDTGLVPRCALIDFTLLADDSLIWIVMEEYFDIVLYMVEWAELHGLTIKEDASFSYSKDHVVGFLKVYNGYVLDMPEPHSIGDVESRYVSLAHSERPLQEDEIDENLSKGYLIHVWKVTGDLQIDSVISKLASYGKRGAPLVKFILKRMSRTTLGRRVIVAIANMPKDGIELYQPDVQAAFRVYWLLEIIDDVLSELENLSSVAD